MGRQYDFTAHDIEIFSPELVITNAIFFQRHSILKVWFQSMLGVSKLLTEEASSQTLKCLTLTELVLSSPLVFMLTLFVYQSKWKCYWEF